MILIVVSTGHFDPLIEACARLYPKYDFYGQIGSSTVVPPFPHVRTIPPGEVERLMKEAELVISHGGAGMTAMLHRLQKRSVIVPKQARYGEPNDLQVELAKKWGELGMGVLCMDVDRLESAIEAARRREMSFPQFARLGEFLREELALEVPEASGGKVSLAGY